MVYAILILFQQLIQAEQSTISEMACAVPIAMPVETINDNRFGRIEIFPDGSSKRTIQNYTSIYSVRDARGLEVFYLDTAD